MKVHWWSALVLIAIGLLVVQAAPGAHDIPADVTVQMLVKPEGQRLRLLVRAPLQAMRDIDIPTRGAGFLDFDRIGPALHHATTLWITDSLRVYEGNTLLAPPRVAAARVSLQSDRSFLSYDAALANIQGAPLPSATELYWSQGLLDVLLEYSIQSDRSLFSIEPSLERLGIRVTTVLRVVSPQGDIRAFEFIGDPGLVRLDPQWYQAAWRFVELGFFHILDGTDHLLFLLCLVIPFRRLRTLIPIVTSFTVAHSITLIASAYDFAPNALWFPPLIETLIAMSIVYMALENIVAVGLRKRWVITFGFGLVHGFGFSFALRQTLQFAGSHLLTSLLSFNLGVELGQLLVLVVLIPALDLLFRFAVPERIGTIILSALVAHTGWHWMTERWDALRQFTFTWPELTPSLVASVMRWLMVLVAIGALRWLYGVLRRPAGRASTADSTVPVENPAKSAGIPSA